MNHDPIVLRLLKHDSDDGKRSHDGRPTRLAYISETGYTSTALHTHMMRVTNEGVENPNNKHFLLVQCIHERIHSDTRHGRSSTWPIVFQNGLVGECNAAFLKGAIDHNEFPAYVSFSIPRLIRDCTDIRCWSIRMNAYLDSL